MIEDTIKKFIDNYNISWTEQQRKNTDHEFKQFIKNVPPEYKPYSRIRDYVSGTRRITNNVLIN